MVGLDIENRRVVLPDSAPTAFLECDVLVAGGGTGGVAAAEALIRRGLSVIVTSTDATDLIAMCGRVLVVGQGEQVGELRGDEITERNLMTTMEARPR